MNKTEKERLAVIEEQIKHNNQQHEEIKEDVSEIKTSMIEGFNKISSKLDTVISQTADKKELERSMEEVNARIKNINGFRDKVMWGVITFLSAVIGFLLNGGFKP